MEHSTISEALIGGLAGGTIAAGIIWLYSEQENLNGFG